MLDIVENATANGPEDGAENGTGTGGNGLPVLVLGHSLGSNHVMWDDVVPLLDGMRVIRYDLPGHGKTPAARRKQPLTMDALVDELLETLDQAGVDRFHIAGLSLGGMVAMAAAEMSDRILSATIMSAGPINEPPQAWWDKAALVRDSGTAQLVDATFERWFSDEFRTQTGLAEVERIRQAFLACDDEGYAQCCEVLAQADLRPGLRGITAPVTLVSAENDATLSWTKVNRIAPIIRSGRCPDVRVEYVDNLRHMWAVEKPELAAQILQARVLGR